MNILNYLKNNLLEIKVIPNSQNNQLIEQEHSLKLYLQAQPEKDKANKAVIKFFKDEFNLRVRIKLGAKNRNKTLEIY